MALTPEDKADVKGAMGKALANKVSSVTKDRHIHVVGMGHGTVKKPENMQRNPVLSPKSKALSSKSGTGKGGFDYDGMMKDVRKSFPGLKVNGKSPYTDKHK